MTHGSLFSGIGGFDLAAEWMGWENKFHCEKEPFPQSILKYYWPNAQLYEDITKSDFTFWNGKIDVLTGGFPCQPYSVAGKQLGKEDDRHLWPEMLRAIREIQPRWVVGENVRGLVNWNAGLVFNEVQADLESEGYEVQPFLLSAAGVGAPHERYRIWFIAHSQCARLQKQREFREPLQSKENENREANWFNILFRGKSVPHLFQHNDGLPSELHGITFSKWRNESIKGYGNAVVVPLVYQLFKTIQLYEEKCRNI